MHKVAIRSLTALKFTLLLGGVIVLASGTPIFAQDPPRIDQPLATSDTGYLIRDLDWHPDGTVLAAVGEAGLVMYDLSLNVVTQALADTEVYGVSWKPDGTQLAITEGNNLETWDWDGDTQELTLRETLAGEYPQLAVAWSPDGTRIATSEAFNLPAPLNASLVGSFHFWNADPLTSERAASGYYQVGSQQFTMPWIYGFAWDPTCAPVIAGAGYFLRPYHDRFLADTDGAIYFIDAVTGVRFDTIEIREGGWSSSIAWHPGGDLIAITPTDAGSQVYRLSTREFLGQYGSFWASSITRWSPDGRYLADDTAIAEFGPDALATGMFDRDYSVVMTAWHPDGTRLAVALANGQLRLEDVTLIPGFTASPPQEEPGCE